MRGPGGTEPRRGGAGGWGGALAAWRSASVPARVAGLLLAAEALVLLALGVLQVLRGLGNGIDDVARAETGGVLAIIGGLGVAVLAVGVLGRAASLRSPTLVVQILCLPVAWGLLQAGVYAYGVPLLAVPIVIIIALLAAGGFGPAADEADDAKGQVARGDGAEGGGAGPATRRSRRT
ncbi:Integral membrane protein [Frankia sp. AgKG'84/4]